MASPTPELPRRLGVFPLPQVVLFPHVHLPLHVFEPRYRALLDEALRGPRVFAMAVLKPGYEEDYYGCPEVHPWACAGRVVKHQRLADGCSDVVLRGERVVRIDEFVQDVPFRAAHVTPQPDEDDFVSKPGAEERRRELRALAEAACPGVMAALESRLVSSPEQDGGLELLHTLAASFPAPVETKLEWLACAGSLQRWDRIRATLSEVARERTRKTRAIARYSDLKPPDPTHN